MRFLCRDQNTGSRAILRDGAGHLRMALATAWLVALLVAGQTALAADPAWQVQSVDGTGTVTRADGVRLALEPGAVLGGGDEIATDADTRAVLTHGTSRITLSPRTKLTLPKTAEAGTAYRIVQSIGSAIYKVKQRAAELKDFGVETPFLAAVVKGTTFRVDAASDNASVRVTEGLVAVASPLTTGNGLLSAGDVARIHNSPGATLQIERQNATNPPAGGTAAGQLADKGGDDNDATAAKEKAGAAQAVSAAEKKDKGAAASGSRIKIRNNGRTIRAVSEKYSHAATILMNAKPGDIFPGEFSLAAFVDAGDGRKTGKRRAGDRAGARGTGTNGLGHGPKNGLGTGGIKGSESGVGQAVSVGQGTSGLGSGGNAGGGNGGGNGNGNVGGLGSGNSNAGGNGLGAGNAGGNGNGNVGLGGGNSNAGGNGLGAGNGAGNGNGNGKG